MRTYRIEYKYLDTFLEEQIAGCELVIPESYRVPSNVSPIDVLLRELSSQWSCREEVGYMRCEIADFGDTGHSSSYNVVCDVTYDSAFHKFWVEIRIIPEDSGIETPVTGFWVTLDGSDLIVGR